MQSIGRTQKNCEQVATPLQLDRLLVSWWILKGIPLYAPCIQCGRREAAKESGLGKPTPLASEVLSILHDTKNLQQKELERTAWESGDPFGSLLALEIATELSLIPDSLDVAKVESPYDELIPSLDRSVVAKRVSPARDRLAADLARFARGERLVVGEEVPDFDLVILDVELISLKAIMEEMYGAYQENGFETVTISTDTDCEVRE